MKLNKIVLPLALALIAALATSGCQKKGIKTTMLPDKGGATGRSTPSPSLPPSQPFDTTAQTPVAIDQKGPQSTAEFDLTNYTQDPAALAAYTVHFKFDSATVEDNEQANIASVGQSLTGDQNLKLLIEGHCDERGTEEYNRSLGERRALALREALHVAGIDPMRVKTISYGKDKPEDPGHDEAAWSKNRRGVFILLRPKAGQ